LLNNTTASATKRLDEFAQVVIRCIQQQVEESQSSWKCVVSDNDLLTQTRCADEGVDVDFPVFVLQGWQEESEVELSTVEPKDVYVVFLPGFHFITHIEFLCLNEEVPDHLGNKVRGV
jgi:hypothetical protein